jgi:hypothetical protein
MKSIRKTLGGLVMVIAGLGLAGCGLVEDAMMSNWSSSQKSMVAPDGWDVPPGVDRAFDMRLARVRAD